MKQLCSEETNYAKTRCARISVTHITLDTILAKVLAHKHTHTNTLVQGFLFYSSNNLEKNAEDHYRNIEHSPK